MSRCFRNVEITSDFIYTFSVSNFSYVCAKYARIMILIKKIYKEIVGYCCSKNL